MKDKKKKNRLYPIDTKKNSNLSFWVPWRLNHLTLNVSLAIPSGDLRFLTTFFIDDYPECNHHEAKK